MTLTDINNFIPLKPLIKLPTSTKKAWLRSLRYGDYKQGKFALRREHIESGENAYCCIGVLADILKPRSWKELPAHSTDTVIKFTWGDSKLTSLLGWKDLSPTMQKVMSQEFKTNSSAFILESFLIQMNDSENFTFLQIADWIERNL